MIKRERTGVSEGYRFVGGSMLPVSMLISYHLDLSHTSDRCVVLSLREGRIGAYTHSRSPGLALSGMGTVLVRMREM